MKQMKVLHQGGFKKQELMAYCDDIYRNLREVVEQLICGLERIGIAYEKSSLKRDPTAAVRILVF